MKARLLAAILLATASLTRAVEKPGLFFEPDFPFYQTQIDLTEKEGLLAENFAVRGLVVPLAGGVVVAFDQDLLRVAGVWTVPEGKTPVTLTNMAQISYARPHDKCGMQHAKPTGPVLFPTGLKLGASTSEGALKADPREKNRSGDLGRGPLPPDLGRFGGVEICGPVAVLHYRVGQTEVREWHEVRTISGLTVVMRHFAIEAHQQPLHFAVGPAAWSVHLPRLATSEMKDGQKLAVATNSDAFTVAEKDGELIATLAPGTGGRVTLALAFGANGEDALPGQIGLTPPVPSLDKSRRWTESVTTEVALDGVRANGLALDMLALPERNPWKRRVRTADIGFLSADRAAVVTYDGDVWLIDGLQGPTLSKATWRRFASGLHEPLALAVAGDVVQVATKNGLVRLYDRDGNGEADWYENFSDAMRQSQSTRAR